MNRKKRKRIHVAVNAFILGIILEHLYRVECSILVVVIAIVFTITLTLEIISDDKN